MAVLIFGVGTFMIGVGLGRWSLEALIDDLYDAFENLRPR